MLDQFQPDAYLLGSFVLQSMTVIHGSRGACVDRLRVIAAGKHKKLRYAVVQLLRREFDVVSEVGDGQQLVEAAIQTHPDVIVSDIRMPLMDGFTALKELRSKHIQVPFVFMTLFDISEFDPSLLQREQPRYVHKADLEAELNLAVQAAADGQSYLSRSFRKD